MVVPVLFQQTSGHTDRQVVSWKDSSAQWVLFSTSLWRIEILPTSRLSALIAKQMLSERCASSARRIAQLSNKIKLCAAAMQTYVDASRFMYFHCLKIGDLVDWVVEATLLDKFLSINLCRKHTVAKQHPLIQSIRSKKATKIMTDINKTISMMFKHDQDAFTNLTFAQPVELTRQIPALLQTRQTFEYYMFNNQQNQYVDCKDSLAFDNTIGLVRHEADRAGQDQINLDFGTDSTQPRVGGGVFSRKFESIRQQIDITLQIVYALYNHSDYHYGQEHGHCIYNIVGALGDGNALQAFHLMYKLLLCTSSAKSCKYGTASEGTIATKAMNAWKSIAQTVTTHDNVSMVSTIGLIICYQLTRCWFDVEQPDVLEYICTRGFEAYQNLTSVAVWTALQTLHTNRDGSQLINFQIDTLYASQLVWCAKQMPSVPDIVVMQMFELDAIKTQLYTAKISEPNPNYSNCVTVPLNCAHTDFCVVDKGVYATHNRLVEELGQLEHLVLPTQWPDENDSPLEYVGQKIEWQHSRDVCLAVQRLEVCEPTQCRLAQILIKCNTCRINLGEYRVVQFNSVPSLQVLTVLSKRETGANLYTDQQIQELCPVESDATTVERVSVSTDAEQNEPHSVGPTSNTGVGTSANDLSDDIGNVLGGNITAPVLALPPSGGAPVSTVSTEPILAVSAQTSAAAPMATRQGYKMSRIPPNGNNVRVVNLTGHVQRILTPKGKRTERTIDHVGTVATKHDAPLGIPTISPDNTDGDNGQSQRKVARFIQVRRASSTNRQAPLGEQRSFGRQDAGNSLIAPQNYRHTDDDSTNGGYTTAPDATDDQWRQGIAHVLHTAKRVVRNGQASPPRYGNDEDHAGDGDNDGSHDLQPSVSGSTMPARLVTRQNSLPVYTSILACLYYNDTTYMLDDSNTLYSSLNGRTENISEHVSSFGIYTGGSVHMLIIVNNNKLFWREIDTNSDFENKHIDCTSVNTAVWPDLVFASNNKIYKVESPDNHLLILDANMPVDYFQMDSKVLLARSHDCNSKVFVKQSSEFIPMYNINKADVRATIQQNTYNVLLWRATRRGKVLVTQVDAASKQSKQLDNPDNKVMFYASDIILTIDQNNLVVTQHTSIQTSDSTESSLASTTSQASTAPSTPAAPAAPAVRESNRVHARPGPSKRKCAMPASMHLSAKLSKHDRVVSIDVLDNQLLVLTTSKAFIYNLETNNTTNSRPISINVAAKLGKLVPDRADTVLLMTDKLVLWTKHKKQIVDTFNQVAGLAVFCETTTNTTDKTYALVATNPSGEIWQVNLYEPEKQLFTTMRRHIVSIAKTTEWVCVALHANIVIVSWANRYVTHVLCRTVVPAKLCSFADKLCAVSDTIQVWPNCRQQDVQTCSAVQKGAVLACAVNSACLFVAHLLTTSFIVKYELAEISY